MIIREAGEHNTWCTPGRDPRRLVLLSNHKVAGASPQTGYTSDVGCDVLVVVVGPDRFAFPSAQVRGIDFRPALTPVPLVPPYLLGISSMHGTLQAVADLAAILDARRPAGVGRYVVNVTEGDLAAGLVVDAIETVVHWPDAAIEALPATDGAALQAVAVGRVADGNGPITLVDVGRLLGRVAEEIAERLLGTE